jgi:YegS/Rv2252/BmrU family lipid kinase
METLIIVNPHAAGGRAERIFRRIESRLVKDFGRFVVAVTERPEDVASRLDAAAQARISRLIAVGGDGTNHVVLNALAQRPELKMAFGSIPVGTGRDWSRALGVPPTPAEAVDWLARARPFPCDLGKAEYLDAKNDGRPSARVFLNIASAGVSGEVDARVNRARRRSSLTFLRATLATLVQYKPQRITVLCDGKEFYSGRSYLLAVANGRCFGRGMWIAPHALIDDGLFDVVLVEGMSRPRILLALRTVFSGKHIERGDVRSARAASVEVHSEDGPLSLDFDGEEGLGQSLRFTLLPAAVNMLLDPSTAAVKR